MSATIINEAEVSKVYLTISNIYDQVKKAMLLLPISKHAFQQSVEGILNLTKFINERTKASIPLIGLDQVNELISKLDEILSEQFIKLDDGLDHLRCQLSSVIHKLISSLIAQKAIAEVHFSKKAEETAHLVKTRYEQAKDVLKHLLASVQNRYPEAYGKVSSTLQVTYDKTSELVTYINDSAVTMKSCSDGYINAGREIVKTADSQLFIISFYLLKLAQPYVQKAVSNATPYIATAVEVSTPYVVQAKPYFDPIVNKVQGVNSKLQEHKVIGPYVHRAIENATIAFEETKSFCIPIEQQQDEIISTSDIVAAAEYEAETD